MTRSHPLLIAVPALAVGGLATAMLTTTAKADPQTMDARSNPIGGVASPASVEDHALTVAGKPTYHLASDEATLNKYAEEGYVVKMATGTNSAYPVYLMQRFR